MNSTESYVLVTDGIIEMSCIAHSIKEATDLFLSYLKNKNDVCIYEVRLPCEGTNLKNQNDVCIKELRNPCEIYEYEGTNLNTVHLVFTKKFIDFLRIIG